jgi:deazaflavin-dependent oxidoreductase (nitroreductase family)
VANWAWVGHVHRAIFLATNGRIGGRLPGLDVLLLTTTGRKTGLERTLPMPYFRDADDYIIVGSNGGQDRDPAWWLNLQAEPSARVRIGQREQSVRARLARPEERERLWPRLTRENFNYARYAKKTTRQIPVVVLSPDRCER